MNTDMKRLTCVAIDDEPIALDLIRNHCNSIQELHLLATFEDAVSGLEYLQTHPVDLLFIDISMPDISGIDVVRSLKRRPMVVFTTAFRHFAFEGYELEALDYILKPVAFERFQKAVRKAVQSDTLRRSALDGSFYVYSEYRLVKIDTGEILYIQSLNDYIRFHFRSGKPVLTLMPLKKVLEKLPEGRFMRVHKSYIVAVNQVRELSNRKLMLESGVEIPVGESFSAGVKNMKRSL